MAADSGTLDMQVVAVELTYGRPNPMSRRIRFMGRMGDEWIEVRIYLYIERARIARWEARDIAMEEGTAHGGAGEVHWATRDEMKGWRASAGHYVVQMLGSDYAPLAHLLSQPGPTRCRIIVDGDDSSKVDYVKSLWLRSGRTVEEVDFSDDEEDEVFHSRI